MADPENFKFEIRDCRLTSIKFDINRDFVPGEDIELETQIHLEHGILEEKNLLRLFVGLTVSGAKAPMSLSVEMGGLFYFANSLTNNSDLQMVAEINCASIMFPFIRELVADVTRRAGLPPLLLAPINFAELFNKNHPKPQ